MADVLKEVKILFNGDDQVSKTIDQLSGKLDAFAGRVQGATQPLADMAAFALKAEGALAALAAGGLILAFNESKKFESALIELQKVIGDEADKLGLARQNAIALSDTYGEASAGVLRATADWVQAGYNVEDAMMLTKASMDLVIAGSLEANQATEILIGTLKGFTAPAAEVSRVIDILNEVSNKYATDVEQLGIGMAALAPIARLMNMDFEQTAGVLTPIIEIFRSGSEAADALKTALARIVDDRKPTLDTLAALGVSQRDLNGNLRSGYEVLLDVAAAFEKLTPEQQFYHAQNLVGIEQAGRMVAVLSNLDNALEVTKVAYGAQGSALKEVEVRLQSAEVAVNRFIAGAQNLAIAVGDQFRLAAKEAIDGGTEIENALRKMVDAGTFNPVLDLVSDFATQLGADLKEIAKIMPEAFAGVDWSKLTASIKNVGGEVVDLFEAAFGDVDLTTVEGLQSAIQRVVDGVAALNNVVAGILDAWEPFVRAIASAAEKFSDADAEAQGFAGNILGMGQVVNKIAGNFDILTGAMDGVSLGLKLLSGSLLINAVSGFTSLAGAAATLGTALLPLAAPAAILVGIGQIAEAIEDAVPSLREMRENVGNVDEAFDNAVESFDALTRNIGENGEQVDHLGAMFDELNKALDQLPEEKSVNIEAEAADAATTLDDILKQIQDIPFEKTTEVTAKADLPSIAQVKNIMIDEWADGSIVLVQTDYDKARLASTSDAINKALPPEKEMELRLKGDIEIQLAQIENQAKTAQAYFEYKAKVDVAEVEALFSSLENQSDNIADMFANTGDVLQGLAAAFADVGGLARLDIMELMIEESRRRDELLIEQRKLTDAQVKYLEARSKAMDAGQGIITISAEGLEPELELVLQKIVQLTQIRANEEGLEFLLGVS